ncbi:MAG: hypothetical protein IJT50_07010 [Lentisphaeria bacterium]|nr:hypothetical protein [Lentisphaeria bacterium]
MNATEKLAALKKISSSAADEKRPFSDIDGLLTEETADLIFKTARPAMSLRKLFSRIEPIYRFNFWKRIFQLREHIPAPERFHFWFSCMIDRGGLLVSEPRIIKGREYTVAVAPDPELLWTLPLTDEMLIDNPLVCRTYSEARKPGWEILRYIAGRRAALQKMPERMRQAIADDNAETFMIYRDMSGKNLSYSLLVEIMRKGAAKIFAELVKGGEVFEHVIPPEELCVCCASQLEDAVSIPLLEIVEGKFPGILKNVRDDWGRNPLWYAAANRRTAFFHPFCRLTPFLLKHGCDPENENQLGLSWRRMLTGLSLSQKKRLLRQRHLANCRNGHSPLGTEQPCTALLDESLEPEWLTNLKSS